MNSHIDTRPLQPGQDQPGAAQVPAHPASIDPANPHPQDEHLHANLKALGGLLTLAEEPGADRISGWKSTSGGAYPNPGRREAAPMARRLPRRRRWLAALSGAAAVLAAGSAILLTTGRSSQVNAATILDSLRRSSVGGVRVTLTGIEADGSTVEGQVAVRFQRPLNIESILDGNQNIEPAIEAAFANLDVRLGQQAPVPGLTLHVEGALAEASSWLFVNSNEIPAELVEGNPTAAMLANFMRSGLIVDFGAGAPGRLLRQLELQADADDAADAGVAVVAAEGGGDDAPPIEIQFGGMQVRHEGAEAPPALRRLLTGQASQQELEEVGRLLRDGAQGSELQPQADGRYVLILHTLAENGEAPADGQASAVRISYAPGLGVEWVEISNVGTAGGTLRIDFLNDPIDPAAMGKDRLVVPGRTMTITEDMLRAWLPQ